MALLNFLNKGDTASSAPICFSQWAAGRNTGSSIYGHLLRNDIHNFFSKLSKIIGWQCDANSIKVV